MAYPQGFLFPPLSSCPSVLLPRAGHEGSAFAPYTSSSNPHAPYGGEPRAAAAISSFLSPGFDPSSGLDYHAFGALGPYPYGDSAYRKNTTRDATATLKAWLNEHRKNPYPTKGEKIMLAIITKMTLTQVSTWFANARRRLKKENKMTWTPRTRSEDEEEEDVEAERTEDRAEEYGQKTDSETDRNDRDIPRPASTGPPCSLLYGSDPPSTDCTPNCTPHCSPDCPEPTPRPLQQRPHQAPSPPSPEPTSPPAVPPKPKLWSLAEIATSSDKHSKASEDCLTQRTSYSHGTPPLHRPLFYPSPFIYNYNTLSPGLTLNNGLHQFSRGDFKLRTFGHERDDFKKGTTSA